MNSKTVLNMPTRRKTIDEWEWLKNKLGNIGNPKFVRRFVEISDAYYEAHGWTALKLIVLAWWVTVYTRIISKRYPGRFYYVDLLAGPGINKIKETGDFTLGSPLLASLLPEEQFSRCFFFEINESSRKALLSRLQTALKQDQYEVYGDCNIYLDEIMPVLKRGHYLAFVDYEKFENVPWTTLGKLLATPGDVVLTLQTAELNRIFGLPSAPKLTREFYGVEGIPEIARTEAERLELYKNQLRSTTRDNVLNITVKGGRGHGAFHYDVILAARKTKGGSPWWKSAEELKKRIEEHTGEAVERALHVLSGKQLEIEWFSQQKPGLDRYLDFKMNH